MVLVSDVDSVGGAIRFVLWCLGVMGLRRALFASFPAGEIAAARALRWSDQTRRLRVLRAAVVSRMKAVSMPAPHRGRAASVPMSDGEVIAAKAELAELAKASRGRRAVDWLLSCVACQLLWSGLLMACLPGWVGAFVATLCAISETGVLIIGVLRLSGRSASSEASM